MIPGGSAEDSPDGLPAKWLHGSTIVQFIYLYRSSITRSGEMGGNTALVLHAAVDGKIQFPTID
jgi:hypothetical protein